MSTLSSEPLSMMDHKSKAEDMHYLIQARGPGTGWVFRMVTPIELVGKANPWTGKPFGKEIRRGLKTRSLPEVRGHRDVALGEVRKLALNYTDEGRLSLAEAEAWREAIREDESEEQDTSAVLLDKLEAAASRGVPEVKLRSFGRVAFGRGFPISKALAQYVEERSPANRRGYKPLARTTVNNLNTAVRHLRDFLKDSNGVACLEDVTPSLAQRFSDDYLPNLTGPRSPEGMAHKTVAKNITLLTQLWAWAVERRVTHHKYKTPWVFPKAIARAARSDAPVREDFSPVQVNALLAGAPSGTREGDLLRLALITGCRADEIASLPRSQVSADATSFTIGKGKTANAVRYVPVPEGAQALLKARLDMYMAESRLFPEWPVRASVGKVYALPQWFTRYRRNVLGTGTDGTNSLHSLRHTWRTVARRARVNEADINDLGGWTGPRSSNSVYDHGLLEEQLRDAQEKIWAELLRVGYLLHF